MRHVLAVAIVIHPLSAAAYAQTSDGGFDKLLSPSLAASAKAMFVTIRRDVAEAARQRVPRCPRRRISSASRTRPR